MTWSEADGELRVQHLQGDRPVVPQVLGEKHGCHTAPADLAVDPVAIRHRGPQAIK